MSTESLVGTVIGGVLVLVTIIGITISIYAMCCKKEPNSKVQPDYNSQNGNPHRQGPYGQPTNTGYYGNQYPPNQGWGNQPYGYEPPPPSYYGNNVKPNPSGKY